MALLAKAPCYHSGKVGQKDRRGTAFQHAKLACCLLGEIYHTSLDEGAAIIDLHFHTLSRVPSSHQYLGTKRQASMGGGKSLLIEGVATGRATSLEPITVERRLATLGGDIAVIPGHHRVTGQ